MFKFERSVTNKEFTEKLGRGVVPTLEMLFEKRLIDCPRESISDDFVFVPDQPIMDSWILTPKGEAYAANYKYVRQLKRREALVSFISGIVTGFAVAAFTYGFLIPRL